MFPTSVAALLLSVSGFLWLQSLEPQVHGRSRDLNSEDDVTFGVHEEMLYAKKKEPVPGTMKLSFTKLSETLVQWMGLVLHSLVR